MPGPKQWLYFAECDLVAAKAILNSDDIRIPPILNSVQQSVEKSLKTYLIFKKQPLKKTHDLVELVNLCSELDADFLQLITCAKELSPCVTKVRYPDSRFDIPSVSIAEWAIKKAEEVFDFVAAKVI